MTKKEVAFARTRKLDWEHACGELVSVGCDVRSRWVGMVAERAARTGGTLGHHLTGGWSSTVCGQHTRRWTFGPFHLRAAPDPSLSVWELWRGSAA